MADIAAEVNPPDAAASPSPAPALAGEPAAAAEATRAAGEGRTTEADQAPLASPQPPPAAETAAAGAEEEVEKEDESSSAKRSPREVEHGFNAAVNPVNKERMARILERRQRAQRRLEEAKKGGR
ncbi:hypothetical protein ACSSS7_004637 [Eimeria intestinalis]